MAEREGQQFGNYRLMKLLGQGGFAEVYLGEHIYLGTKAAIKLLYTRVVRDEVAVFQQEARTLANLEYPNIVRVRDFGIEASTNTPYLVMDYASGGTLRQCHPKGSRLPLSTVVEYVKQVAAALQHAHDQRLIHRDVKPENMLLGRNGEVLLSDFGIALFSQSTRYQSTKDMAGTIAYMAPEQIERHPRPASDQYSLGIVVYEWLTGTLPFSGSFTEVAVKHSVAPPPPLRNTLPTLSPAIERVVLTALAKKPEERFSSVRTFATALEQASREPPTPVSFNRLSEPSPAISTKATQLISSTSAFTTQSPREQSKIVAPRGISRRTALAVLLGVGVTGVGIVGTRILLLTRLTPAGTPESSGGISPTTSLVSPTSVPQGTLYLAYRGHSNYVTALAWSPDGKRITSASVDYTVQVWDAATGGNAFTYRGHSNWLRAVAWSPDGKRIASGGYDQTVQVWDATTDNNLFTYDDGSIVFAVAWSPASKRIASGCDNQTVQVWDAANGDNPLIYRGHSANVLAVAWSPDGKRIASGGSDRSVQVWDAANGGNPFTYRGHASYILGVAWSPNSKHIASASADQTVQVWDAANGGNVFTYRGHSNWVRAVAWSPDGTRIASGSVDKTVQVWDATTGSNVFTYRGHSDVVNALAWSPDGTRIASGGDDNVVQVWQAV